MESSYGTMLIPETDYYRIVSGRIGSERKIFPIDDDRICFHRHARILTSSRRFCNVVHDLTARRALT